VKKFRGRVTRERRHIRSFSVLFISVEILELRLEAYERVNES